MSPPAHTRRQLRLNCARKQPITTPPRRVTELYIPHACTIPWRVPQTALRWRLSRLFFRNFRARAPSRLSATQLVSRISRVSRYRALYIFTAARPRPALFLPHLHSQPKHFPPSPPRFHCTLTALSSPSALRPRPQRSAPAPGPPPAAAANMLMAALPRARSSVSSELCDMARLRERAAALSAKDAEWQECMRAALRPSVQVPVAATSSPPLSKPEPEEASLGTITLPSDSCGSPRAVVVAASPASPMEATSSSPAPRRARRARDAPGRVGKIRRRRLTKEEEARYASAGITDLAGTTAAQSRKMSAEERDLMLHKRRLRNRQSAARSRDKQRKTIADLAAELDDLAARADTVTAAAARIQGTSDALAAERDALRAENDMLRRENAALRAGRPPHAAPPAVAVVPTSHGLGRSSSAMHLSISSDQLEGFSAQADPTGLTPNTSLLRIPSLGFLRMSSDRLADIPKAPMRKNYSYLDRILDFGTVKGDVGENPDPNSILTRGVAQ